MRYFNFNSPIIVLFIFQLFCSFLPNLEHHLILFRRHLVLNCEGDLHIFPFDSPMCDFNIESVFHTADKMKFLWSGRNKVPEGEPSGIIDSSKVLK